MTSLGTQIKEEHLTCSVCLHAFRKPKALPCLHTFCELCLHDYVVSRGYESAGTFPCPLCRLDVPMPPLGIMSFPDNHLVASLSDTVDHLQPPRPVPKPRRSLGQIGDDNPATGIEPMPSSTQNLNYNNNHEKLKGTPISANDDVEIESSPGPEDFEIVEENSDRSGSSYRRRNHLDHSNLDSPPPAYSQVADTHPARDHAHQKICLNDTDPGWMVVPNQSGTNFGSGTNPGHPDGHESRPPQYSTATSTQIPANYPQAPIGWNVDGLGPPHPAAGISNHQQINSHLQQRVPSPITHPTQSQGHNNTAQHSSSPYIYPTVPSEQIQATACAENLMLRFGKQGSTARDFIKPIGLAVSREGHYIVSDNGGDQNRFLVFDSGGEITTSFKCGCKVKDIAITQNNEIIAAVHKANSAIRRFTLGGQLKGEYGKFFTYEEPSGISELTNRGIALTGATGHCVYVLSDQMKLQTKFGRKGNGDGYFSHPGFMAVGSKNHIVVSDKVNGCVQVFNTEGKFKQRFGSIGSNHGQLQAPMGVCVDSADNIIIADSGNFRVEAFSSRGKYLSSVVRDTWQLGENVKPVNVCMTPTGKVAVLLRGPYFAEVRIYSSRHQDIPQDLPNVSLPGSFGLPIPKSFGWPS